MKYFLYTFLLSIIIFYGCEQSSGPIIEPPAGFQKIISDPGGISNDKYELLTLPVRSPIYNDSVFTVTKLINGLLGGIITLDRTYISADGRLVTMLVELVIPPLSFNGQDSLTLTIDSCFAAIHCGPGMNFNQPLVMLQTFTGLELSKYNTEDIDFAYINDNGSIEEVDHSAVIVIKATGTVTVVGAHIPHFSKYGWVRKH